jgi:hypothetical protein
MAFTGQGAGVYKVAQGKELIFSTCRGSILFSPTIYCDILIAIKRNQTKGNKNER